MNNTIIYLIRHAESKGNLANIFGGDPDITEKGEQETKRLQKNLAYVKPNAVYASNTKRAKQTAKILAKEWSLPVKIHDKLHERNFGSLEGKEILQEHKDFHNSLIERNINLMWDSQLSSDDETNRQSLQRLLEGLVDIAKSNIGKATLVVSHGDVIAKLLVKRG